MARHPQWNWWEAALNGSFGPIVETQPESGFYRHYKGEPVAFWRDADAQYCKFGNDQFDGDIGRLWMSVAKSPVSKADYDHRRKDGSWPADLPPLPSIATTAETAPAASVEAPATAGHNSGDLAGFRAMREQLLGDVAEAKAYFAKNAVKTKTDADKLTNWAKRIREAATAADNARKAEKKPFQDAADAVDERYFPFIREAAAHAKDMQAAADKWARDEQDRLTKVAQEEARKRFEAERAAAETARKEIEAARAKKMRDDPIAAMTEPEPELPVVPLAPAPVVAVPKVMLGTDGPRRGVRAEPDKATIVNLAQAAAYYAEQQHPDLVALIQKLADKAAKAKAKVPGTVMSWERMKESA